MTSADDIIEAFNTIAAALDQRADWLEDQQAGGKPDKVLVRQAVADYRYLASVARVDAGTTAAARGEAATP
jgi:predicted transcriptional regulator